jgi:hypothetical protein
MNKAVIFFMAMAVTFSPVLMSIAKAGMLDNYNLKVKVQGIDVCEIFKPRSLSDHTQSLTNGQKHAIGLGIVAVAATVIIVADDDDDPVTTESPIGPGPGR